MNRVLYIQYYYKNIHVLLPWSQLLFSKCMGAPSHRTRQTVELLNRKGNGNVLNTVVKKRKKSLNDRRNTALGGKIHVLIECHHWIFGHFISFGEKPGKSISSKQSIQHSIAIMKLLLSLALTLVVAKQANAQCSYTFCGGLTNMDQALIPSGSIAADDDDDPFADPAPSCADYL